MVDFYREIDDLAQWGPGDRGCQQFADRLVAQLEAVPEEEWKVFAEDTPWATAWPRCSTSGFFSNVPVGRELVRLIEERGWIGWTRLVRIETATAGPRT